ncbi:Gfo/Idh/MocA family oxidoreductase [Gramella sp. AN32]|uniref:Gfo/Idh/MocA family protein n=1 Tax=Christiangramia antarctica TaxID=2058158 RepID=A0ABW5X840_9FLAO|nr:Gfo/Idh/MocA family oxidoreductase [Gramella sp. AN32]MCM4154851.1 oxidoreductase [Gramella sp. AN32]
MKNNSTQDGEANKISRRKFVRNTSMVFGAISIVPRFVLGRGFTAPSDKINLGYIGLGKQGNILASKFLTNTNAQIVAGSEVWDTKRTFFKTNVEAMYAQHRNTAAYKGVRTYLNYQEMLERKDIDAVVVATPDHWHALQCIDAMKAGKDVFCEKPLTNTIKEGRQIVDTAEKTERVFQTGSMQRSWDRFIKAKELVSSGALGNIKKVLVNVGDPAIKYNLPPEPLPEGIDWNLWCGPAPLLGYNDKIAPAIVKTYPDWRNFEETGGGILSDWGAHMFDIAQWALGMDHTGPVTYIPPSNPTAVRGLKMFYENGVEMVHEDFGRGWAVRFIGTEGSLDVSRSFLETTPKNLMGSTIDTEFKGQNNHYQDWLSAIKTRGQTIAPAEIGHRTATICNVANIAYDLNRPLNWNLKKERFKGDRQANKMRKRHNRDFE